MPQSATPGIGEQVAAASFTMVMLRLAFRSIGFVSTLILVRLLRPDDFGLVGLATAVFSALDLMTEMSMQEALIRLAEIDRRVMDTAWTMNICRGVAIGGLVASSSNLAAGWMHDARVTPILWVLAAVAVVQGFENIGMAEFRRNLKFNRIFQYELSAKLASFCVTIAGAAWFRSYWALVAGIATFRIFMVAYSYVIQPYRPRLSLAAFHELFHFSKWFMATNMLTVIEAYTNTLLFGRIGGATAVGLYQISWQIGSLPTGEIAAPIRDPIYAGYARLLGNLASLRRHFLDGLALMTLVVAPLSVGIALCADLVCQLLLGPKWAAATGLIRLCALYALFDTIGHFTHNVFVVLNRQRRLVLTYAPAVILRFGLAVWAGLAWGVKAALWVLTITAVANAVIWSLALLPVLHLRLRQIVEALWRTAASCGVMAGILLAFVPLDAAGASIPRIIARAVIAVSLGAAAYGGTQALLWRLGGASDGPETRAFGYIAARFRRRHVL